jgi:hypothetical protein
MNKSPAGPSSRLAYQTHRALRFCPVPTLVGVGNGTLCCFADVLCFPSS